ncbi:hypothetical protein R75465_02229 [Paraburkholderia aspalathi]|uniref:hypothetical protein n=1 Tax=Paraburkholderia aspalathi TaxID=1324617 RepID=UPI001B211583|nr:hypothetical protein [Paraburkholderia aspalathi]CAE6740079.1 hypothetical protein R75465_02229 [Paraburkholderia aspalathi]
MSAQKITDEQWAEARKRYETEPGLGLGKIAQALDCSKSLVARKAREGKWQKDIGVPNQVHPTAREREAKVTESAVPSETQAVHVNAAESPVSPAHAVFDVYVAPSARGVPAVGVTERPEFTNGVDELAWIEEQVSIREKAILARHAVELKALTNSIYDAARKTGKAEMGAASRAANQLSQALERKQKMEREHCAMQTRIELGAHYGAGPRPAVIVVHQHPDGKLT